MKFTCEKSLLVNAISVASRTVAQKSAISALEGIYVRAGMHLYLSGYNLETGITVTVPAALPVSVVDGEVLVANNAKITNNAKTGSVQVTGVLVEDGSLTVANYDDFDGDDNTIALSINSCGTKSAGELDISEDYFPDIEPGKSLPIHYHAKVAVSQAMKDATAATVIFTIASVD